MAASHFTALTIRLALAALGDDPARGAAESTITTILADGVDAFLRAYR